MQEKPIIFSTKMVKAILDGRKTHTRRVIRGTHKDMLLQDVCDDLGYPASIGWKWAGFKTWGKTTSLVYFKCPYGHIGDRLWVRETWAVAECYDAIRPSLLNLTCRNVEYAADPGYLGKVRGRWRPSIFMPIKFARIWLEITGIRVERLQDITDEDVLREGFRMDNPAIFRLGYQGAFESLWDSINAKKHPWSSNSWVWVVEFKMLQS